MEGQDGQKARPRAVRRKWPWIVAGVPVVLLLAAWIGGGPFITRKIETVVKESLAKRELGAEWKGGAWDPFRGVHMEEVRIFSTAGGERRPVAEAANLDVSFSLWKIITGDKDKSITLGTDGADVVLTDAEGPVALREVTARVVVRPGGVIRVTRAEAVHKGLRLEAAEGDIVLKKRTTPATGPFSLKLGPLRGTLASLDFREGTGPFRVKGNFHVDLTGDRPVWRASAKGEGKDVEYHGARLARTLGEVELDSDAESVIRTTMFTPYGEARCEVTRADWQGGVPFHFHGTLKDKQGRESGFKGNYQDHALTVERLSGSADLLEMARAHPVAVEKMPRGKARLASPGVVELRNVKWRAQGEPRLAVEEVSVKGGLAVVTVDDEEVELKDVSARVGSSDGKSWRIAEARARVFSGTVTAAGNYADGVLRQARLAGEGIRMAELKLPGGDDSGKAPPGILSFAWSGTVDSREKTLEGGGSMRLDQAPVFQVPLLDQVYDLFAALIPGIERSKEGSFEADFTGDGNLVRVKRFEAKGGSLTVSATGTVDLKKERVDGKARGKLGGLPGMVTSPLSRLLEMEVGGPYDDIRVKPLGPAQLVSNTASATVGVAVDTIGEGAKVTGTLIKEGIKVPFKLLGRDKEEKKK